MLKRTWFTLLAMMLLGLCSCVRGGRPLSELTADTGSSSSYLVRSGDSLMIEVWGEPRLTGERSVRDDGKLTMPLINDIDAQGKSLEQIGKEIEQKLAKFIPGASVSVSVGHSAPIRYYLSGLFQKPGEYRSDARMTLLQAVAAGGGFQPFADKSAITLIRRTPEGEKRYLLDYNRMVDGREPNPILQDGDLITID